MILIFQKLFGDIILSYADFYKEPTVYYNFFGGEFGLSRLTSLQFFLCHVAGFYKPTIPQSPPSNFWDYSTCNNARLEFSTIFVPCFDPNDWCLKNGLHSGSLNPGPLGHKSSALTTRPVFFNLFEVAEPKMT
jgi:hypothetical protein